MQVQTYFRHAAKYVPAGETLVIEPDSWALSNSDPRWMKIMVYVLTTVDTVNSVVSCYVAYDYSVRDFGALESFRATQLEN